MFNHSICFITAFWGLIELHFSYEDKHVNYMGYDVQQENKFLIYRGYL